MFFKQYDVAGRSRVMLVSGIQGMFPSDTCISSYSLYFVIVVVLLRYNFLL